MNILQRIDSRLAFVMAVVMGAVFCGASANAQSTWSGTIDDKWSTVGNWNFLPGNNSNLVFSGTSNQINTNNAGITSIGTLTLSTGGWDIKLGASKFNIGTLTVTGSSLLTGNVEMVSYGSTVITLNGTAGTTTLTIADKLTFTRANNTATLSVNGPGNTLLVGSLELGSSGGNKTINGTANVTVNGPLADTLSGTASFIWSGSGTFTLNGTNTYNCPTIINAGTFALGASASINATPSISIGAGGTFDVSAQSAYTLSTNLTASGSNTAATVKGAVGGTVSLGGKTVTLNWRGASAGVVSDRPPLTVSQATLVLNNDPLIVNVPTNMPPLGEGIYTLISAPAGISGTVNSTPVYSGSGIATNLSASAKDTISISGNSVILSIVVPPAGTVIITR